MAITTMHPRLLGSEKSSAITIVSVLNSYKIPSTLQQPAEILPEYSLSFLSLGNYITVKHIVMLYQTTALDRYGADENERER